MHLQNWGLNSKVVDAIEALYTNICSCINVDCVMSEWLAVCSSVKKGCRIAPDLFVSPTDYLLEHMHRFTWGTKQNPVSSAHNWT